MPRYIDADKLNAKLMDEYYGMISDESMKIYKIIRMLDNAPTADVLEVKHGKWIFYPDCGCTVCSNCRRSVEEYVGAYDYCMWCGARMDLED